MTEKEYAFDVNIRAVARVKAITLKQAIGKLEEMECVDLKYQEGAIALTEGTVDAETAECFEVAGRRINADERTCRHCGEIVKLIGGKWQEDSCMPEHPEICSDAKGVSNEHVPVTTAWYCQNCAYESDDENDFIPTDGTPAKHLCPDCRSIDVFPKG